MQSYQKKTTIHNPKIASEITKLGQNLIKNKNPYGDNESVFGPFCKNCGIPLIWVKNPAGTSGRWKHIDYGRVEYFCNNPQSPIRHKKVKQ